MAAEAKLKGDNKAKKEASQLIKKYRTGLLPLFESYY